jgi:hypothetical protein
METWCIHMEKWMVNVHFTPILHWNCAGVLFNTHNINQTIINLDITVYYGVIDETNYSFLTTQFFFNFENLNILNLRVGDFTFDFFVHVNFSLIQFSFSIFSIISSYIYKTCIRLKNYLKIVHFFYILKERAIYSLVTLYILTFMHVYRKLSVVHKNTNCLQQAF